MSQNGSKRSIAEKILEDEEENIEDMDEDKIMNIFREEGMT